jgi:hypothetical protein
MPTLKYLRHFQRSNFKQASRVQLTSSINREMEILMQHYLTYLLERNLNTPSFLWRVRKGSDLQNTGTVLDNISDESEDQ